MTSTIQPRGILLAAAAIAFLSTSSFADDPYSGQPGSVDLHFGEWGMGIATSLAVQGEFATTIGTDSQGRIVVGGNACIDGYCGPLLMRFDDGGALDTSGNWGPDGAVFLAAASTAEEFSQVAIAAADNDGWWISWQSFANDTFHLLRIGADGNFVAGFAPGERAESIYALASVPGLHRTGDEDTERLIGVTAGLVSSASQAVRVVRRLGASGERDPAFGDDGEALVEIGLGDVLVDSEVLGDGRIAMLTLDYSTGIGSIYLLEADGSGLSAGFGDGGVLTLNAFLADALDAEGISAEYMEAGGMAMSPAGSLLVGFTVCCGDSAYRAGVLALDGSGGPDADFGGGGVVLHPSPDEYIGGVAFGVDPLSGNSVLEVWRLSDSFDAMLHFTADGDVDAAYGDNGLVRDLRLPGNDGITKWAGTLAFDASGGVLFPSDNFGFSNDVIGLDGFGAIRFLAAGESRLYDASPNAVSDFTWPSAPLTAVLQLMQSSFGGRDVAIAISVDSNGRIGGPGDGEDDYSLLPSTAALPLGITAKLFHKAAATPGTRNESHFNAGGVEFTLASVTGVDRTPDVLTFYPRADVPRETFVVSGADVVSGIDVAIDISVENGCYFLFDGFDELPADSADWPQVLVAENCTSAAGHVEDGQVLFLAHVSADAAEETTATTLHYGDFTTQFLSTTATTGDEPGDAEPPDVESGGGALLWLLPLLLPLRRRHSTA